MTPVVRASTSRERRRALVALLALGLAAALVLGAVLTSWLGAAILTGGLAVILVAVSDAVARRGVGRAAVATVAIIGFGVVVVGLVIADPSWWRAGLVVLITAVSLRSARAALSGSELSALMEAMAPVPRAERPVLIINPRSGDGKAARHRLVEQCQARRIEPIVLEPGDDLVELADGAIRRGADVIGMAGGDGSQALVAEVAIRHGVAVVVVPSGTRNHFALDLGLDRDDVVGALAAFDDAMERRVDVAVVNGRVFVNNASLGVYAKVVQSESYRGAKGRTVVETVPDLLGPGAAPLDLRYTAPDGSEQGSAHLILVSNGTYQLHRLAVGRFRRSRLDAGELGLVAVRFSRAADVGRFVALEATGRGRRFPGWFEWSAPRFRVDSDGPVEIGVDGEALLLEPPLVFETRPRALRVRLPTAALPLAAERRVHVLSSRTIRDLVALVAGRS